MRIEQSSDEHGIYIRASEEAFLVTKEEAASIRKHIDELRELVWDMLRNMHGCTFHHDCGSCGFDECIYEARARDLGVDA